MGRAVFAWSCREGSGENEVRTEKARFFQEKEKTALFSCRFDLHFAGDCATIIVSMIYQAKGRKGNDVPS